MAKRIIAQKRKVDVVYNNMQSVRQVDNNLNKLSDDFVNKRVEIDSSTSFSDWNSISEFSSKMLQRVSNEYETIYSRVMWPASNFAAFEYKLKIPDVKWSAEFSDPILYDIFAKKRYSKN